MHTRVSIVAEPGRSPRIEASGGLAVRLTGSQSAHLIGTAATPLGGDHIEVSIRVAAGARLRLGSVAAMLALPVADRPDSTSRWTIEVGDGGWLRLDPQPTVIAGGAAHRSDMVVDVHSGGAVELHEHVQIGRSGDLFPGDASGSWSGGMCIDAAGSPLLRHRISLGAPRPGAPRAAQRAVASVLRYPDPRPDVVDAVNFATRLQLAAGGTLTTALGPSVTRTREMVAALDR